MKLKGEAHVHFIKIEEEICFIELRNKPLIPMLKVLHKFPNMMTKVQCDKGAIKHILSGSNIMAPGLTSEGGVLPDGLELGKAVAIMAEGKEHAMGIGFLLMSSDEIKTENKGMAVELV